MARYLDVVAMPDLGWHSPADRAYHLDDIDANKPADAKFIRTYTDIENLVGKIQALRSEDPDCPCLRTLELNSHGCPVNMDSLFSCMLDDDALLLKGLPWCDNSSIWLAGCNTGCRGADRGAGYVRGPLAKDLADKMAFDPGNFAVHLTVHGMLGYSWGTHFTNHARCVATYSESHCDPAWDWPWNWFSTTKFETYEGAVDATGDQVWQPFKNGSW